MALGDTYNSNEKKNYSPSVASGIRFANPDSTIDKTALSFTYWNKLLKISIAPKKETNDDQIVFDHEHEGSIYLSHKKALIFYKEIMDFLSGKSNKTNAGVSSGKEGLIYICDGKEFNADGACLVIRKINSDTGECSAVYVYEFNRNNVSIIDYVEKSKSYENTQYPLIEIEQIATVLKAYHDSMTMAVAYSVMETQKYDTSRNNTKLKLIADKLGIEFRVQNSNASRSSNNSYFSSANKASENTSYNSPSTLYEEASLDDLN